MFSSPRKNNNDNQSIDTVIGMSTIIEGNINSKGIVRIDGQCHGDIDTDADVTIGETGIVTGEINANNVHLAGKIEGNVNCKGLLEILSTGQLIGDIEVESIAVNKGAIFRGKVNMQEEKPLQIENQENIADNEA